MINYCNKHKLEFIHDSKCSFCVACYLEDGCENNKTITVKTARIDEIIEEFKNDESDNCDDIRKDIIEMLENLKNGN